MDLIKKARLNHNKCVTRIQCGWEFLPRILLQDEIYLETPFEYPCQTCQQISLIDNLDQFCEKCYNSDVYPHASNIYNKINNFDIEILEEKQTEYLDTSTLYKIKVNEFYCTMFCGLFEEPNEWSSSPHDDYLHITSLFIDKDLCDKEYDSLEKLKKYLKY